MGNFGLNDTLEYTELNLDSFDAASSANSGVADSSSWPLFYYTSRNENVVGVKVLSASIPFVFYPISSANNTFTYTEGATPYTITIAPGNYTGTTLASALQTAIQVRSAGFTVSYSTTTLLMTFTHNTATAWSIYFPTRDSLYSFMGFKPQTLYSASGIGSVIVSPYVARASGPDYLYLNSRKLGPFINFNLSDNSATGGDFPGLCRIPINASYGSTIIYEDPDPEKYFDLFLGNQFDSFDFFLTLGADQSQVPLDMRGVSWSIKLAILSYRKATEDIYQKPQPSGRKIIRN